MKKRMIALAMTCILVLTFSACAGSSSQAPASSAPPSQPSQAQGGSSAAYDPTQGEKIVIKYATEGLVTAPQTMASLWAMDRIEEETKGRITFDRYTAGALGTGAQILQQLMDGSVEVADVSVGLYSSYIPTMQTYQLPFLITTYEKERAAIDSPEGKALLDSLEEIGVKGVSIAECGMRHFAHATKPINTVDDLKGVKIRIVPSNVLQDAMTMLGASPVPLAYGEVYSGLQNKVIDAMEINLMSMDTMKFYEVTKYFSYISLYPMPIAISYNKDFFYSLSPEDQALILKWYKESETYNFETSLPQVEGASLKVMLDAGVTTNEIEDAEPFKKLVVSLYDEYADLDPRNKAFIDMAMNLK